jgi:hypothetical protein
MLRLINHWVSYFITTTNTTGKLISSVRAKTHREIHIPSEKYCSVRDGTRAEKCFSDSWTHTEIMSYSD